MKSQDILMAAVLLGRLGGKKKSNKKKIACQKNGKKGGRPKKEKIK